MPPPCPLTGESDVTLIGDAPTRVIQELYDSRRGVDVTRDLRGDKVRLWRSNRINFYFFEPFIAGSEYFYDQFASVPEYATTKWEFRRAADFIASGDKVLDIGAGQGHFAQALPLSCTYTGLEMSSVSASIGQSSGLDLRQELLDEHVADGDGYDFVAAFQVLEHVEKPLEFLSQAADFVRPGGRLAIAVPNALSAPGLLMNRYLNLPPHHISWWTIDALRWAAEALGFQFDCAEEEPSDLKTDVLTSAGRVQLFMRPRRRLVGTSMTDKAFEGVSLAVGVAVALAVKVSRGRFPGKNLLVVLTKP